jgi:tetratricopeptide (TPR) repeat protein
MKSAAIGLFFVVLALGARAQTADDPLVQQRRVAMVLRQVTDLYEGGEYQAAADRLAALPPRAAEQPDALNMRGAIYTKLGRHREARQIFLNILDSDRNYFPAYFNLGEVQNIQGDHAEALETFRTLARNQPRNELVRFKIFVCLVQLGNDDEARNLAASFIPAGSSPAWYYAQSVLARQAGDQRLADKHLRAARSIYSSAACKLFDEAIQSSKL